MPCTSLSASLGLLLLLLVAVEAKYSSGTPFRDRFSSSRGLRQINQTYTDLQHIPESLLGDSECQLTKAAFKGTVLQSGLHHKAHSISDCRQQCQ